MFCKVFIMLTGSLLLLQLVLSQSSTDSPIPPGGAIDNFMTRSCEYCTPLLTSFCCKFGYGCCPQFNPCRDSLRCSARTTCDLNNCEFGCCKFSDGQCCSLRNAGFLLAPMFGLVSVPPPKN